ncbi:MAG: hypothetical protein D6802_11340, partial [Ardenticatenia bacterium]
MKKFPPKPKKPFERCRTHTFTLSGPTQALDEAEASLKTLKALGVITRQPDAPPIVVKRKNGEWREVDVSDSDGATPSMEVRTYRYTKRKPVDKALSIINAYLAQNPNCVRVRACEDDAFINPNEGNPAPNEGNPAPNEGNPAPNEGNPAPNEGNPAPNEGNPAP